MVAPFAILISLAFAAALAVVLAKPGGYDELQHLSYTAAMQERPALFPRFDEMRLLDPTDLGRWQEVPNYHSHPSVFYILTAPLLDRAGAVGASVLRLRLLCILLVGSGLVLAAVAARRLLARHPGGWPTFCIVLALCPQLVLVAAHYNNEALGIFAGALSYAAVAHGTGRLRFAGLFVGTLLAMYAKLSAGLLIGIWSVAVALLLRAPKLAVAPVLAAALGSIPYAANLWSFGALVPITLESIHGLDAPPTSLEERLVTFAASLPFAWGFGYSGAWANAVGFAAIAAAVTYGIVLAGRRPLDDLSVIAVAAGVSLAVVLPIHAAYSAHALGGNASAAAFRYYLPLWPMLAHAAVLPAILPHRDGLRRVATIAIGVALAGGFVIRPD